MQVRLSWEETKVAAAWILGSGFAAVIAFLALLRPALDAAWCASLKRNGPAVKEQIAELFEQEIERWNQAAVNADTALAVNQTLEHMAADLERQGQILAKMSGYLQSMTGGSWSSPSPPAS